MAFRIPQLPTHWELCFDLYVPNSVSVSVTSPYSWMRNSSKCSRNLFRGYMSLRISCGGRLFICYSIQSSPFSCLKIRFWYDIWYDMIWYDILYYIILYYIILYYIILYYIILYYIILYYIWYDIWYNMIWYDIWYDMIWYNTIQYNII